MATYPWRFQADIKIGHPDPDVTVFVGDTITNDTTGEKTIHQSTADPVIVKMTELAAFITTSMANGVTRAEKPPMPGAPQPEAKKK